MSEDAPFVSKVIYLVWKCNGCDTCRVRRTHSVPSFRYQSPCPDKSCPVKRKRLNAGNTRAFDTREEAQTFADINNGMWL